MDRVEAREYLSILWDQASYSNDPSTQLAACVRGFAPRENSVGPWMAPMEVSALTREQKYAVTVHSETHALLTAGSFAKGNTMYALWYACSNCAAHMIAAGITKVIGYARHFDNCPERWKASVDFGIKMLEDRGVECLIYDGEIDAHKPILFNGELWTP